VVNGALRIWTTLFSVLAATGPAMALSPEAEQAIDSVRSALQHVRDDQSRRGSAGDENEQLIRLGELDQAGRSVMQVTDLSNLSPEEKTAVSRTVWAEIDAQDAVNEAELVSLIPPRGWFTADRYTPEAASAAWSVVQHAVTNLPLMERALAELGPAARAHSIPADEFGMLSDRVAMLKGRPQTYGSQFKCVDHRWSLYDLEDPAHVDDRRRDLGMTTTEEQVKERIAASPPCVFAN
jgi:hypothetical protein